MNLTNAEELDLAATSDIYWQHTLDDDASFNDPDIDDNQLAKYLAVVVDRTGKPVEMRGNNDQFSCDTRNLKSAQSQFPLVTQPEMICQTGGSVQERIAEERENAHAQIRTMLDEQRKTIIAGYGEKVLHHEFLAAQAEQNRRILQEELLRQQQDFREDFSSKTSPSNVHFDYSFIVLKHIRVLRENWSSRTPSSSSRRRTLEVIRLFQ